MNSRRFYIYEYIRLDTNEPFYIGKGCGNRAFQIDKSRNANFRKVLQKSKVACVLLMDNLTEQEAYEAEVWFIYEYKHILSFKLTNMDDGGLGAVSGKFNHMYGKKGRLHPNYKREVSEESRKKMSIARKGPKNHMYGKRGVLSPIYGLKASEDRKKKISESLKGKVKSETHIANLKKSLDKRDFRGSKNPNYGNGEKIAGLKNKSAVKISVFNNEGLLEFEGCKLEVVSKYNLSLYLLTKLLDKKLDVEKHFNRDRKKFKHLQGYEFKKSN